MWANGRNSAGKDFPEMAENGGQRQATLENLAIRSYFKSAHVMREHGDWMSELV